MREDPATHTALPVVTAAPLGLGFAALENASRLVSASLTLPPSLNDVIAREESYARRLELSRLDQGHSYDDNAMVTTGPVQAIMLDPMLTSLTGDQRTARVEQILHETKPAPFVREVAPLLLSFIAVVALLAGLLSGANPLLIALSTAGVCVYVMVTPRCRGEYMRSPGRNVVPPRYPPITLDDALHLATLTPNLWHTTATPVRTAPPAPKPEPASTDDHMDRCAQVGVSVMATPSSERVTLGWDEVRALYPGTADVAYLDSAAVGLVSTRVRDAVTSVLTEHLQLGGAVAPKWRQHAGCVRTSVARLVGGRADQIAFTQNTGTGLATVTNGLEWRDGDNVVVPAAEFPSNFYPWLQLRRRGVQVREVAMTDGRARVDDILAALDRRTRVLAISAVQYSSGYRYDLGGLGQACQDSDVLLVVDGTQAVGAVTVDAELLGVDVLAVSAHKWMLGPRGIGFIHLSQRAMQRLVPSTVGWLSVEDPFAFDHEPVLARDGRRFESGAENSSGIAGLGATVDLVHELGRQRVEDRVLDRATQLATLFEEVGMTVHLPSGRDRRSGIVIASSPSTPHQALHDRLISQGVRCSLRGSGLRFAPHYFTTDSDLHRAADALRHPA